MQEAEVDLEWRRARLEEELSEAHREERRLGRRVAALDRQVARRAALIETLEADVARAAGSRSFRFGHGALRGISRWLLRRPARRSALDEAAGVLEEASWELTAIDPAPSAPAAPFDRSPARSADPVHPPTPPMKSPRRSLASAGATRPSGRRTRAATVNEDALRSDFRVRYEGIFDAGAMSVKEDELSGPLPCDRRNMLVGRAAESEPDHPSADVIVCVRDAPDDVRSCLWSLLHTATRPFHLIVVDDGSQAETMAMLERLARREPKIELIRNDGPEHGYTRAANIGLRASSGAHVVLLNSDTVVSPRWLERIVACMESDPRIGIVGPLSNAATHQSVPLVKQDGRWAVNELPPWLTVDSMALLVTELSSRERPRVPFVNGFCYAMTREAIDRVGLFDEERFGSGYCEENDFSIRARDAGFSLALADDAYVFHGKSKSYTSAGRDEVARRNYQLFLEKHGAERVRELLAELEDPRGLKELRATTQAATADEQATIGAFRAANPDPLAVLFVLHGMPEGSGGGVHSVYQEATGMRRLGVPARIAIAAAALPRARAAYADADDVFVPYDDEAGLAELAVRSDLVVATHFSTVALVGRIHARSEAFLPAYYAQDYEPFFVDSGSSLRAEAHESYTAIPGQLLFAKTHWLRNLIGHLHGVDVAKVEPSVDLDVYSTDGRTEADDGRIRIAAMIRPRTPRRQPVLTLDVLSELVAARGDRVEVTTFGCQAERVAALGRTPPGRHLGLLTRHQVAALLKRSDVFLDASTYQAFGRTAIEAMACGCTAIVPRIGGANEFVRHEENGLLADTLRPGEVSEAVGRLVDDGDLRRELQAAAPQEARKYSVLRAALSEYALFARGAC